MPKKALIESRENDLPLLSKNYAQYGKQIGRFDKLNDLEIPVTEPACVKPAKFLEVTQNIICPLCGSSRKTILVEKDWMRLYSCPDCRSNFQERLREPDKPYDESYFSDNHEKAYGKSYMEDEGNIRAFSRRRLHTILKFAGKPGRLLDVGSALGLFCDEANKLGFHAFGAEISEYARNFAKVHAGIESFPDFEKITEDFDCITLWFTLEHIENPQAWVNHARELLPGGGILALSVPNGWGAYARFNPGEYYEKRPIEHYAEPSLDGMEKLLEKSGFEILKTEIFGLHPRRFGWPEWNIVKKVQKILQLGDTFEIYARKK